MKGLLLDHSYVGVVNVLASAVCCCRFDESLPAALRETLYNLACSAEATLRA